MTRQVTTLFKQPKQGRGDKVNAAVRATVLSRQQCQAVGLHHRLCPWRDHAGRIEVGATGVLIPHHVLPQADGGPPTLDNLLCVWNNSFNLGAAGCHGLIHSHRLLARALGLLRLPDDDPLFGIGYQRAVLASNKHITVPTHLRERYGLSPDTSSPTTPTESTPK